MSQPPSISIVIPAFNAATVIGETLDSVQRQTFQDFEAIIVDDGSTDDTCLRAQEFCDRDKRFRLLRQPHAGVSAARNAGYQSARGEFIAFLDADDLWFPEKLERQMALFRADPRLNFAYTNYFFWDGQRDLFPYYRARHPLPDGDAGTQLVATNVFGISTLVLRRELLVRAGGFDPSLPSCEDWDLWLRMLEHGLRARGTREPLGRYRRWPGSMSNKKLIMAECDLRVLEKNFKTTNRAELRPFYRRSIALARAKLELAHARLQLDAAPEKIPAAIWRAWRHHPRKLKWLMWFALVAWPKLLGGTATQKIVHRKLIQKF